MPVIKFSYSDLIGLLGKEIPPERLEELIPSLGADIERIEGDDFHVEFFPDRPDLYSVEGVARALRLHEGIDREPRVYVPPAPSGIRLEVDDSVKDIRPFIACAVARNLTFTDAFIKSLMELQEKLHVTLGRKRRKVAIGVHDITSLEPPFRYAGVRPDAISFVPLGTDEEMTLARILEDHEKGIEYASILRGKDLYPIITDSHGQVLSFPPIINGELTAVRDRTTDLFIDMTGTDMQAVSSALNILTTAIMERGAEVGSVEIVYPEAYHSSVGGTVVTPDYSPALMDIEPDRVAALLGLPADTDWEGLAAKMGYVPVAREGADEGTGEETTGRAVLRLMIPPYRSDILHPVDVMEDLAIAYGYRNFLPRLPGAVSFGERLHSGDEDLCRKMVGLGFNEIFTLTLSSLDDQNMLSSSFGSSPSSQPAQSSPPAQPARSAPSAQPTTPTQPTRSAPPGTVVISNPITTEHDCLRWSIVPSLLGILKANKHRDMPQRVFEIGQVVLDGTNRRMLACAITHGKAGYTEMKSVLEALCGGRTLVPSAKSRFIPGRGADFPGGNFGELHPSVIRHFGLDYPVTILEIDVATLLKQVQ